MVYDVIIIGAGVAGLAAGLKLSSSGKKALLIEKQFQPGGFAAGFLRKGYLFESALHCVDGLAKGGEVRDFLEETGIDQEVDFIELKDFCRIIYPEHEFSADFNPANLKEFLKDNFPTEKKGIIRFFTEIERFSKEFTQFSQSELPLWLNLILSPFLYRSIIKVSRLTLEQFMTKFIQDEKLKAIIGDIWRFTGLPPSKVSALYFLIVFEGYHYHPTAYIKGGFTQLFKVMIEKMKQHGCEVKFNTTVKKIVTEKEKNIISVITDRNEEFKARVIISNASPITTLTNLLDNHLLREEYSKRFLSLEKSPSAFQVYLGLKAPAKELGMKHFMYSLNLSYNHDDNFHDHLCGNYNQCPFSLVDHAQIDPSIVPPGKGSLLIMVFDNYENWSGLTEEVYREKKIAVAHKLIARAQMYLPELAKNIEVMEVATPRTFVRFGQAEEGAIYGFAQTLSQSGVNRLSQKTKIKGLFLAGGWTRPGAGVHACIFSGIEAANLAMRYLK